MKVEILLNGKSKKGFIVDERNSDDQDKDCKEYLVKYSWFKKPVWIPWFKVKLQ